MTPLACVRRVLTEPPYAILSWPSNIKLTTFKTGYTVEFEPPDVSNGVITKYIIYYAREDKAGALSDYSKKVIDGTDRSVTINNLNENTAFIFRMQAVSDDGPGIISEIYKVKTESDLSNEIKDVEAAATEAQTHENPTETTPEPSKETVSDRARQLSAESSGKRRIKSIHGTYLRGQKYEDGVDFVSPPPREWENWYIVDWEGKVAFKAIHLPKRYIRADPEGNINLLLTHPQAWELWSPFKNEDGSWSFQSHHGQWLSADADGRAHTVEKKQEWEHFWLEEWWD